MLVLALDTTGRPGSLALWRDGRLLVERAGEASRSPGERLPGEIVSLLQSLGLKVAEVDVYAVTTGPGSFTGMRVGIATIQGLALVNGRGVVPVSAFEAVACQPEARRAERVAVWIDARRGEVFAALYGAARTADGASDPSTGLVELIAPEVGGPAEVLDGWRRRGQLEMPPPVFTGDGASAHRSVIEQACGAAARVLEPPVCLAGLVAEIAAARAAAGGAVSPHAIVPVYVRRPDAEIARELRNARR
jgi:tRNA threonylcarbamoyladenosine biosynthesis protein TsaB